MKPKVTCPVCGGKATGPYSYKAMSKSGAYYTYQRYAHASKGSVTFCHVKKLPEVGLVVSYQEESGEK